MDLQGSLVSLKNRRDGLPMSSQWYVINVGTHNKGTVLAAFTANCAQTNQNESKLYVLLFAVFFRVVVIPLDRYCQFEEAHHKATALFRQKVGSVPSDDADLAGRIHRHGHCLEDYCENAYLSENETSLVVLDADVVGAGVADVIFFDEALVGPRRTYQLHRACCVAFRCTIDVFHGEKNLSVVRIYLLGRRCGRAHRDNCPNTFVPDLDAVNNLALDDTNADDRPSFPSRYFDRHPCFREFAAAPVESCAELPQFVHCFLVLGFSSVPK